MPPTEKPLHFQYLDWLANNPSTLLEKRSWQAWLDANPECKRQENEETRLKVLAREYGSCGDMPAFEKCLKESFLANNPTAIASLRESYNHFCVFNKAKEYGARDDRVGFEKWLRDEPSAEDPFYIRVWFNDAVKEAKKARRAEIEKTLGPVLCGAGTIIWWVIVAVVLLYGTILMHMAEQATFYGH